MEAYFDIIFALNEMTHPGEKRMMEKALEGANVLPVHFEENIKELYFVLFTKPEKVENILEKIEKN